MSLDVEPKTDTKPPRSPWRWVAAVVAAAVVVVAVVASLGVFGSDSDDKAADRAGSTAGSPAPTVTVTAPTPSVASAAPAGEVTALSVAAAPARCIPPTAAFLAKHAAVAFEGTVTDLGATTALLTAKSWLYADGFGGTDTVRITLPVQTTELTPTFEKGKTYLVAAGSDSKVLACGYTDVKGAALQKMYATAFK